MRCNNCGLDYPKGTRYCSICGRPLSAEPNKQNGGGVKKWFWILLLLLALALAASFLRFCGKETDSDSVQTELETVDQLAKDAVADLLDKDGTLPEEKVPEALEKVYEAGKRNGGGYTFVEKETDCVTFGIKGGGTYVYLPPAPAGEIPPQHNAPEITEIPQEQSAPGGKIATVEPFFTEINSQLPRHCAYIDAAAETITEALPVYTFHDSGATDDDNRDDREADLEFLKNLSAYSVVVWMGHGGFSQRTGSFLATRIPYNARYDQDFRAGRLLMCSSGYCVTPAFFDQYLGQNANPVSVVYLGACQSADDSRLANSLLGKGFDCVIANENTILTTYNALVEYTFYAGMAGGYGSFFTAGEALQYAKWLYGDQDPIYGGNPQLFGDPEVCFVYEGVLPSQTPTATPNSTPVPTPAPTQNPVFTTDAGRADGDFGEQPYLALVRKHVISSGAAWTPPIDVDTPMCAGIIKNVGQTNGIYTIEVDYAGWNWNDSDGVPTLQHRNTSNRTYVLPLSPDCLISIPWPDRTSDSVWGLIDDDQAKASAFYGRSDWETLRRCYDQVTDPGTSWSQPSYFFIALNDRDEVTCIWQDVYFYVNN